MCSFRWAAEFAGKDKPEGDQRRLMKQFTGVTHRTTLMIVETRRNLEGCNRDCMCHFFLPFYVLIRMNSDRGFNAKFHSCLHTLSPMDSPCAEGDRRRRWTR